MQHTPCVTQVSTWPTSIGQHNRRVIGRTAGDTFSMCLDHSFRLRVPARVRGWLKWSRCIIFGYTVLRQEGLSLYLWLFIRARRIVPGGPTGDKVPTPSLPLSQVVSSPQSRGPRPQPYRSQENWAEAPPCKGWVQRRFTSCAARAQWLSTN